MISAPSSPQKVALPPASRPIYLCQPFVEAALVTGKFKTIVQFPRYSDVQEWVAMNLFDFYTNLNLFLGFVSETCTIETCSTMAISSNACYPWIEKTGRATLLPAGKHIDYIMTWIQSIVEDQSKFPTRAGFEFSSDFPIIAKSIYRQILHVFAHLFYAHYTAFLHSCTEAHFNSFFAHFLAFGHEFNLLEQKDLMSPDGTMLGIGELQEEWKAMGILSY